MNAFYLYRNLTKQNFTILLALLLGALLSQPSYAKVASRTIEYNVKSAYLYNFLKFVTWPDTKQATPQSEIPICLLGEDQLLPFLEPITELKAQGRRITILNIDRLSQAKNCQLLFIGESETKNIPKILAGIKGSPFLVVSSVENFAASGGMIGFVQKDGKVRIEINNKAVKRESLKLSAKLLEVATIVE